MTQQTDFFAMFNIVDEVTEKKRKEEEEKAAKSEEARQAKLAEVQAKRNEASASEKIEGIATKKTTKAPEVKKEDEFKPNESTVIRYYGESLEITSYFSTEELAEGLLVVNLDKDGENERRPLTAELLRARMENDFPELVKSHTEIIFLKDKNLIIPTMKAKKKGNCMELSNDNSFPFPKIPFEILRQFLALAKHFGDKSLEVHADIYYNKEVNRYFLDIPKQTVHTYWVEVTESGRETVERVMDNIKVLEIHSHHGMYPTPSSQDNESERVPGMHYAIVGNTQRYFPDVFLRQFISETVGHRIKSFEQVFECPFTELPSFDMNQIEVSSHE
ncbi:hypothetical protein [Psychrobacillus sp. FSL H8-0510]|uniref:hypothetical protein n=1 Tax=Psychrobacillus sp. FSL H8-0510 TaxID=2921394 RepID=UPI0030FBBB2E